MFILKGDKSPMSPFKNSSPKTRKPPNRPYLPQSTSCQTELPVTKAITSRPLESLWLSKRTYKCKSK